jgi:hypothetical protein
MSRIQWRPIKLMKVGENWCFAAWETRFVPDDAPPADLEAWQEGTPDLPAATGTVLIDEKTGIKRDFP